MVALSAHSSAGFLPGERGGDTETCWRGGTCPVTGGGAPRTTKGPADSNAKPEALGGLYPDRGRCAAEPGLAGLLIGEKGMPPLLLLVAASAGSCSRMVCADATPPTPAAAEVDEDVADVLAMAPLLSVAVVADNAEAEAEEADAAAAGAAEAEAGAVEGRAGSCAVRTSDISSCGGAGLKVRPRLVNWYPDAAADDGLLLVVATVAVSPFSPPLSLLVARSGATLDLGFGGFK